jgi:hypothetical protein
MGTLTTNAYSVEDGEAFLVYLRQLFVEIPKVQAEGRVPSDSATLDFLDDLKRVQVAARGDVASAKATGAAECVTSLDLTPAEYKRLLNIGETLQRLLQILEMRKAVVLNGTEASARVTRAFRDGTFTG